MEEQTDKSEGTFSLKLLVIQIVRNWVIAL